MNNISYNNDDEYLDQIVPSTSLDKEDFGRNYRIHGLKQNDRPPVLIEYNVQEIKEEEFSFLRNIFKDKINIEIKPAAEKNKYPLYIGLRMDVRQNQKYSAALIKTIILHLEKRLAIKKDQEIKIPIFS